MRISAVITMVILCLILTAFFVVNALLLELLSSESQKWVIVISIAIILIYIVLAIIVIPTYKYKIFKYKLENNEITVRSGLFFVKVVRIPLFRIQNVDTHEGLLMRKYKLASLTLSTAGGNTNIKLIDKEIAASLKAYIKNGDSEIVNDNDSEMNGE
ncbi:PH domain-containing protein [Staphylococcus caeli]|uniref:Membrane spanning protein n=1 Tax=Staphylococcus caeli TaxID=2201815 RepID=A0A1D4RVR3_9STAP|nr:PH domain-containing protein [Staphylococcus caeli]SCT50282.1 membrane spanning protein [Staphylococcus caeli]SCT51352.1 membrane spanning protein [Staphylococcus caeli]